jgi:preprotein translocase subunit SecY
MIGSLGEVGKIPELRKRVLFTLAMLAVYRMGVFVSTPGIDIAALRQMFGGSGLESLMGLINLFSGGALENFSIFSLGIAPYISMSIIIQVLTPNIPSLEALKKEGESGQRILTRYTRYGTIILALFQGYMIAVGLERDPQLVHAPGWLFRIQPMVTLCAGTSFMMWLGEQITERGIGNGTSILIFAGIIARMPVALYETITQARYGNVSPMAVLLIFLFCVSTIAFIVAGVAVAGAAVLYFTTPKTRKQTASSLLLEGRF